MAVLWIVTGDEVVEIGALDRVFLQGEVQVCPQVVDPELRPKRFSRPDVQLAQQINVDTSSPSKIEHIVDSKMLDELTEGYRPAARTKAGGGFTMGPNVGSACRRVLDLHWQLHARGCYSKFNSAKLQTSKLPQRTANRPLGKH